MPVWSLLDRREGLSGKRVAYPTDNLVQNVLAQTNHLGGHPYTHIPLTTLLQELEDNFRDTRTYLFFSAKDLDDHESHQDREDLLVQDEAAYMDAQAFQDLSTSPATRLHNPHPLGVSSQIREASASPTFQHTKPLKKSREDFDNKRIAKHLHMVTSPTRPLGQVATPPSVGSTATSLSGSKDTHDMIITTLSRLQTSPSSSSLGRNEWVKALVVQHEHTRYYVPTFLPSRSKAVVRTMFNSKQTSREWPIPHNFSLWDFRNTSAMPTERDVSHNNLFLTTSNRVWISNS